MKDHLKIIYILLHLLMIATVIVGAVVLAALSKWFLLLLVPMWLYIGFINSKLRGSL